MSMADRRGAFRHAEAPAWVAEQRVAAVAAGLTAAAEAMVADAVEFRYVLVV